MMATSLDFIATLSIVVCALMFVGQRFGIGIKRKPKPVRAVIGGSLKKALQKANANKALARKQAGT